jgi:hypothetical protein
VRSEKLLDRGEMHHAHRSLGEGGNLH